MAFSNTNRLKKIERMEAMYVKLHYRSYKSSTIIKKIADQFCCDKTTVYKLISVNDIKAKYKLTTNDNSNSKISSSSISNCCA